MMDELKMYGEGKQDWQKYIPRWKSDENAAGKFRRKGFANIDYKSIVSVAPKYKRIVLGILEEIG